MTMPKSLRPARTTAHGWACTATAMALALALTATGASAAPPPAKRSGAKAASAPATAPQGVAPTAVEPALNAPVSRRGGDYIVAVVNQELVTNNEVLQRLSRMEQEAERRQARLPARDELLQLLLDQLIDERAQISYAKDAGLKVDDSEVDRTFSSIAAQNGLSFAQLRERLQQEGMDYGRFRNNLRDQLMLDRLREREVQSRIRITDSDIENWLTKEREKRGAATEFNVGQIFFAVPEGASTERWAERRAQAIGALQQLKLGADFGALVLQMSDGTRERNGALGLRPLSRLPDTFADAVRPLQVGEVAPQVIRSAAGFHILKVLERQDAPLTVAENHARHILIKPGPNAPEQAVIARMEDFKRRIVAGQARFDELARRHSEDGSAPSGGDLGWAGPGQFVPEFENAMNQLAPGGVSDPLVSRFGVHLIQLLERREVKLDTRQQREMARAALREQKRDEAYTEWARDIRARAYVELREAPSP